MDRICRMGAAREDGPKVWKTLMSIDISRNKKRRSVRALMCTAAAGVHARDRPSHYGEPRGVFFRRAGDMPPRSLPHPRHPVHLGHPASDAREIKVLTDLFSLLRRRFYRHLGLPDLFLPYPANPAHPGHPDSDGTHARDRPSRYGRPQAPVGPDRLIRTRL